MTTYRFRQDISAAEVRALLDYAPATGDFRWRVAGGGRRGVGGIAGHESRAGYRWISVRGKAYLAHRLAWLHVYGQFPAFLIDHKDRDPRNNRLDNLRPATSSENLANAKRRKDNQSGLKGVCFEQFTGRWKAQICVRGKRISLGRFESREEAHAAYLRAARAAFGQFCHHGELAA